MPAAVAGVGALATQADANVAYKGLVLAHLDEGATAALAPTIMTPSPSWSGCWGSPSSI